MRKAYRLKHKPTGLYWKKTGSSSLSDLGTVFTTGTHSMSGVSPDHTFIAVIADKKTILKHMDLLQKVGHLETQWKMKWDRKSSSYVSTGKHVYTWWMKTMVSDFEKEYVTLEPEIPESTATKENQNLIEQVTHICWDQMFSISKSMMPYEDLLKRVKNQLNNE